MTSLFIDPALFEAPAEPEPRDQLIVNGRYMLPPIGDPTGKRRSLQRVTNFIKQLSDTEGLTKWKLRTLVVGLARDERLYDLATSLSADDRRDLDELIEKAIDLGQAGPSGGNITGTALHNYTDDVPGKYPIRVRDKWVPKIENYFAALHDKGLRPVAGLSERLVLSERYGTCGRLDDVYEDPFGTLRVGDRKSQKDFQTWWEVGAQLALYQGSDAMWNEDECRFEDMPNLADDVAHVAWMPLAHPAAKKGGSVDTVTIYDVPLAGPREVLDWCHKVRTLRTQARQWGQERVSLDDFARTARDIRDAETLDDLRGLAGRVSGDALYEMASNRWEAIEAAEKAHPAYVPEMSPNELARQETVSESADRIDQGYRDEAVRDFGEFTPRDVQDVTGLDAPAMERVQQLADISFTIPREMIEFSSRPRVEDIVRVALESAPRFGEDKATLTVNGTHDAIAAVAERLTFDPALFVGPDATFPVDPEALDRAVTDRLLASVPGPERSTEALGGLTPEQYAEAMAPLPPPETGANIEERNALRAQQWEDGEGMLRKPNDWLHHLKIHDRPIPVDSDGVWAKPMSLKVFRNIYSDVLGGFDHPAGAVKFTHSKHEGATVVELPDLRTPIEWSNEFGVQIAEAEGWLGGPGRFVAKDLDVPIDRAEFQARLNGGAIRDPQTGATQRKPRVWISYLEMDPLVAAGMPDEFVTEEEFHALRFELAGRTITLAPTLDAVPVKIVREVCTRANNSQSSRGRVRLLNDLDKKYEKHKEALQPALLAEWLAVDGGPVSDTGCVKLTGGSSRQPMYAKQAGPVSLTDYLATKEAPKSTAEAAETAPAEVRGDDADTAAEMTSEQRAQRREEAGQGAWLEVPDAVQRFADDVAEVRKPYQGIDPDKHSMLRLIEMAKQAVNGAERAKVFHEITRRKAWTGAIAAEINQYYLDNGYATEDFDPYFEAQDAGTVAPREVYDHLADTTPEGELVVNDVRLQTLAQDARHPVEDVRAQAEIVRRRQATALPLDPDDPATVADALHLLEGVKDRAELAKFWDALKVRPYFSDQALQEALLGKMMSLTS